MKGKIVHQEECVVDEWDGGDLGLTNRAFIALVRAKLDAAGRRDVAVERSWIEEDVPGERWLLNVPVGTEMRLPLRSHPTLFDLPASERDPHIESFAKALINLRRGERSLVGYARKVRRSANAEIASARRDGLDLILKGVGFDTINADQLSSPDHKDAMMSVIATIDIGCLSFFLRPETVQICVDWPEYVADEMRDIRKNQRDRQERLAELDALGCDLAVDTITLDLLSHHGMDPCAVLREAWKHQCVNLPVHHAGHDTHLSLVSSRGVATSSVAFEDVVWNGKYLSFRHRKRVGSHKALVGSCLGGLVSHPLFARLPIAWVETSDRGTHADRIYFDMSREMRFDADTGRIWMVESETRAQATSARRNGRSKKIHAI